jgi:serine/threonine protein phosphatase 1
VIEVFLGDYVDRGDDSHGVIEQLITPHPSRMRMCLRGNHEEIVCGFIDDPTLLMTWRRFGLWETLDSYGVARRPLTNAQDCQSVRDDFVNALPQSHYDFLLNLSDVYINGDYGFVHAGIRPTIALQDQSVEDLRWIREPFLSHPQRHSHYIVHGHTPVDTVEQHSNRLAIDTRAYASGVLSCAVIEGGQVRILST